MIFGFSVNSLIFSLIGFVACHPHLKHQWQSRSISAGDVADEYDFIVVGGGQSGLVIASRLSEDPQTTVLVVEYGDFDNRPEQLDPASVGGLVNWPIYDMYNVTSVPQAGLLNLSIKALSACVVGGGSTINGMMLTRGAAVDYDNWAKLNNEPGWSFEGLLPYFKKSILFQEPAPELAHEYNITWDLSAYGDDSPIHTSVSSWQYPGLLPQWQGLEELGLESQVEAAGGKAYGVFWYPNALDNKTITRSYAVSGYYAPVANRSNLHLLTGHRVNEILFDTKLNANGVRIQPPGSVDNEDVASIKARKEIILAAGGLHSPQVLQRSGIGPSPLLEEAGIEVLVDLPGVGSNLQDHWVSLAFYNYTKNIDPNPQYMTDNETFIDWAQELWAENRTGPLSQSTGNSISLIPLSKLSPDTWTSTVETLQKQNSSDFLPATYTAEQIAGFEAQRLLLIDTLNRNDNGVIEIPFSGSSIFATVLMKGISRGTILLDPQHIYSEPIIDFNAFRNPIDARIMTESFEFIRRWHATPIMEETFSPIELQPNFEDYGELELYARNTSATIAHISGTCALMPRHLGGVVDTDLRVYGVSGLRVVDASIMPMIPGAHPCTTVYAIAEKAADLIKAQYKGTHA